LETTTAEKPQKRYILQPIGQISGYWPKNMYNFERGKKPKVFPQKAPNLSTGPPLGPSSKETNFANLIDLYPLRQRYRFEL
jgi:hypothetical protein